MCSIIVESFLHQDELGNNRVTLLYKNLGSFTFLLKPSVPLINFSDWLVYFRDRTFHTQLKFNKNRRGCFGTGKYETEEQFEMHIELRP